MLAWIWLVPPPIVEENELKYERCHRPPSIARSSPTKRTAFAPCRDSANCNIRRRCSLTRNFVESPIAVGRSLHNAAISPRLAQQAVALIFDHEADDLVTDRGILQRGPPVAPGAARKLDHVTEAERDAADTAALAAGNAAFEGQG